MSAWRSPLLFFGFVLILIAAAALFAPLFVDWNSYRAQFEDYGRKLTGRDVTIAGQIEARLFPWPVLVLNQVTIANREGAHRVNLMEARRIEMGMSLAPLISGQVEVDSIAIDTPVLALERLATGAASWTIEPEQAVAALIDPDRVAVSEISISNATVFIGDHRRAGLDRIDKLTGTLSAPALSGPWRMRATASHRGAPFEITLTTGKLNRGEATRVGLRIAPVEGAGMIYSFDGEVARPQGKNVKGAIRIAPAPGSRANGDAEIGLRPFQVKADIESDFDSVSLSNIEAAPISSLEPGNFITGAARIDLGARVVVQAGLSTARLDLDQIVGRTARDLMHSGDAFEALGRFLAAMPERLELHVDMAASSVVVGGETIEASRLDVELSHGRLRIEEFTTALPGQTRARFAGLVVFSDGEPLMSGDIGVDSGSLRDFVVWAVPEQRRTIEQLWTGHRGRLALEAKLDVATHGVRLSELSASLDEGTFTGSLSSQTGTDAGLALRIDADRLDLDRYLPRGLDLADDSGLAMTLVDLLGEAMTLGDFLLTTQAAELRFHGVEAQDIAIDIAANENGLELRTVEIGRVGAARMDVSGLLRFPGEGVAGSIDALIDAEDPRDLLRLLGAFGPDGQVEPAWAQALGPLDVRLIAEASAEGPVTTASMALTGTAGEASATVEGRFRGEPAKWQEGEIELAGEIDARTSPLLAALTGLELKAGPDRPSRLPGIMNATMNATLAGSLRSGLATTLEAEVFGTRGRFVGTVREATTLEAEGRVAVLAEDAAELLALAGVPDDDQGPEPRMFSAESDIGYDGRGLRLSSLTGMASGTAFRGDITFAFEPVTRPGNWRCPGCWGPFCCRATAAGTRFPAISPPPSRSWTPISSLPPIAWRCCPMSRSGPRSSTSRPAAMTLY
jgi:hypothetical protein